jgi:hypothetical protein
MGTIREHIPGWASDFAPRYAQFSSIDELLDIEWVRKWKDIGQFDQFSISPSERGPSSLMAEYEDGRKWWVIGFIDRKDIPKQLPIWEPKY